MSRDRQQAGGAALEIVYGVHPVEELLEQRLRQIERIYLVRGRSARMGGILRRAREAGIPVTHLPREVLSRKIGSRAVHQGVAAQVAPIPYADADALCSRAASRPDGMLILLDGITDPGNLGAILRSSAGAGADGVLLGREATVGLTPAVSKASAGTVERIPVAREPQPSKRIQQLRSQGFAAFLLDPRSETAWDAPDLTGRVLLVAGGEERGVRPALVRACQQTLAIPLREGVESLNVAVALGVLLFEAVRQRLRSGRRP